MPNTYDQRKLIDQLICDKDMELMPHEINEILGKELSKPADEVDMQLVNELLDLLGAEEPDAADKEACWQSIRKEREPQKRCNWKKVMNRVAAIAAAIVIMFFVSFESAKAFRWTFLLKLLAPVAETFGIYSTSTFDSEDTINDNTLVIDDTEFEQVTYLSIDHMPAEVKGYQIIPAWVPERFAFVQGTAYEDPDMAYFSLLYRHNEDSIGVDVYIYQDDEAVSRFEFERSLTEPLTENIKGRSVHYYHNVKDVTNLSASWVDEAAHYRLDGSVTKEELKRIIDGLME